jgi:phosphopantetheinyl transferase
VTIGTAWLLPIGTDQLPRMEICDSVLGVLEQAEVAAYQTNHDRQLASLSRAAARIAASTIVEKAVLPHEWSFSRAPGGGRFLRALDGLLMNVSIADNENFLAICMNNMMHGIGVDVESWQRPVGWRDTASRFFSAQEQSLLGHLSDEEGSDVFTMLWTGKEALAKASGKQLADLLALPLVESNQTNQQTLLLEGLIRDQWNIRWFDFGVDLVAICCDTTMSCALPTIVPIDCVKAINAKILEIALPGLGEVPSAGDAFWLVPAAC